MAAVTAAVAVGAGMAYSANRQGAAAKKAANAQGNAAQQAMAKFDEVNQRTRADNQPWLQSGQNALAQINALNSGDFSSFKTAPDFLFRQQFGQQGLDRGAAARGRLYSGGYDADRMAYNQGLASQAYDTFYNRLLGQSDRGQSAAQFLGGIDQNYASQYGNALGLKGQADAQRAAAGPMTQAGYGNALASAFSTYAGMGGGGGGGFGGLFGGGGGGLSGLPGAARTSGYAGSLLGNQASTSQGAVYNFGNNLGNVWGSR